MGSSGGMQERTGRAGLHVLTLHVLTMAACDGSCKVARRCV